MSRALLIAQGAFGRVALLDMDRSLVRHAHPHCHVLIKMDGDDTQFAVGDRLVPLTDDRAVLINAWETHAYVHDPLRRNALILALYIEPEWLRLFRANWIASAAPGFFTSASGEMNTAIRRISHDLAAEMMHQHGFSNTKQELLSKLMIAVVERFTPWRNLDNASWNMARRRRTDWRVRRSIDTMRADPKGGASIEGLAKSAGLSRAHFFRLFEQSTGVTPHLFLNVLKVEQAVKSVATGDDSLAAISAGLGFSSPAHFSRFFRDHVSVAPRQFRQALA